MNLQSTLFLTILLTVLSASFLNAENISAPVSHVSGNSSSVKDVISHISGAGTVAAPKPHISGASEPQPTPVKKQHSHNQTYTGKKTNAKDRIALRKACWTQCETLFKINTQRDCAGLAGTQRSACKRGHFERRLTCVKTNCRKFK